MSLSSEHTQEFLKVLQSRFEKNKQRHTDVDWKTVETKLKANPKKLEILDAMEETGGEPDVVGMDQATGEILFYDCSAESPNGRRSLCYDRAAWEARKEHKPKDNALDVAKAIGINLLTEDEYRYLQTLGNFDTKTSSWLKTPERIRNLDGAIFGDYRYDTVFIYHNGVQSYYAARGFRGVLRV